MSELCPYKLIQDFKSKVSEYIKPYKNQNVEIFFGTKNITNVSENILIEEIIQTKRRVIPESGLSEVCLMIRVGGSLSGTISYKEYPKCCGKMMLYHFKFPMSIWETETTRLELNPEIIGFLFKLAFACSKVHGYSMADYVISHYEQSNIIDYVLANKVYDIQTQFDNLRMKHTCSNFIKLL